MEVHVQRGDVALTAELEVVGRLVSRLPGRVAFFAKDLDGRLIAANQSLCHRIGKASMEGLLGRTDTDLFPEILASQFRRDDLRVWKSGKPLESIVEPFFGTSGLPEWCITDKFPLHDADGKVVGLMGTSRHLDTGEDLPLASPGLSQAIAYLSANFTKEISVDDIANSASVSRRTLERLFASHIGLSPSAFLNKTRILSACEKLRTGSESISEIALSLNFCDQSAFARHFKEQMGVTPSSYREQEVGGEPAEEE